MKYRIIIVLLASVIQGTCSAYIYHTQVLRKWDPTARHYHYVIGLSDFHDKFHHATQQQRAAIEQLITKCSNKPVELLVEDLSSPNWQGEQRCGSFKVDSTGGLLGGLSSVCKQNNVAVNNVEYRYCRVAAFGPVLNNMRTQVDAFPSTKNIPMQAIYQEIMQQIEQIKAYNDHPLLQKYYQAHIARIMAIMHKFHIPAHLNMSASDYLTAHTDDAMRHQALKQLLVFDSTLLDFHLVHAVINTQKNKQAALVVAGGSHIKNMAALLEKIGYQTVHNTTITYDKERDANQCIQMPMVNGQYCVKPQAVDVRIVEKFIE